MTVLQRQLLFQNLGGEPGSRGKEQLHGNGLTCRSPVIRSPASWLPSSPMSAELNCQRVCRVSSRTAAPEAVAIGLLATEISRFRSQAAKTETKMPFGSQT